jgi:ankyrin repeat protein
MVKLLGLAVRAQHTRIVLRLLAAGAEATGSNGAGEPLIVIASRVKFRSSEPEIVRALLDAGAEPDARDRDGLTPLMWAAAVGPPDVVALLLRHGADPSATTRDGITAWHVAIGEDVIAILRQARGAPRANPGGC